MRDFLELVAAICVANYLVAFAAIWARSMAERRRMKRMIAEAMQKTQPNNE